VCARTCVCAWGGVCNVWACVCVCVCVCFVMYECFGNMYTVLWLGFFLPWLGFFRAFSLSCKANARVKLAKRGHGPHSSKLDVICFVLLLFVLFYVLVVCKCVLYYCHQVTTQLQLTNIPYHINHWVLNKRLEDVCVVWRPYRNGLQEHTYKLSTRPCNPKKPVAHSLTSADGNKSPWCGPNCYSRPVAEKLGQQQYFGADHIMCGVLACDAM
jgi:hypothetical protein